MQNQAITTHTHHDAGTLAAQPLSHRWDTTERIAAAIRASGLTAPEIAERVGVTPRRVRDWTRGDLPTRIYWRRLQAVVPALAGVRHEPQTTPGSWPQAIHLAARGVLALRLTGPATRIMLSEQRTHLTGDPQLAATAVAGGALAEAWYTGDWWRPGIVASVAEIGLFASGVAEAERPAAVTEVLRRAAHALEPSYSAIYGLAHMLTRGAVLSRTDLVELVELTQRHHRQWPHLDMEAVATEWLHEILGWSDAATSDEARLIAYGAARGVEVVASGD